MILRNKKSLIALAIASIIAASATYADNFTGTATATVVDRIAVTDQIDLTFGSFSVGSTGGTITAMGTTTGDVASIAAGNKARFTFQGRASQTANVAGDTNVTLNSGGNSMTAALNYSPTINFDNGGEGLLSIDGTLTVAANQAPGTYTGTYAFSVNY